MRSLRPVLRVAAALALAAVSLAQAATLRVASAFDPQTLDPHALALLYHQRIASQVYESLVGRNERYELEPALATAWQPAGPRAWRFTLRPGVVFHDGTPMTADDVVFSIERALAPPSQRAFQLLGVEGARVIDASTVEIRCAQPDAVLPEKLQSIAIMSRAWSRRHGVERAQDIASRQETHTLRNANGTGPFRLVRYEADMRTTLARHARWWGWADTRRHGNLQEVVFTTIKSDATRLAALASGEVDLVLDPPFQDVERLMRDPRLTVQRSADLGQQYLVFDLGRDELEFSDVRGRNPWRDKRVRQAVYHAINVDLIVQKVLRGQGVPTGAYLSPRVEGSPAELDRRLPYDPARARALLAEAGYANGFGVTLDCVNVAWREAVCQAAAAMLTQVGIRTTLRSSPANQFFPKLTQATASFAEFGWTPTTDAWATLNALYRTRAAEGRGAFNAGNFSDPALDALIDGLRVEPDRTRRRAMVAVVLQQLRDTLPAVPLYRRTLAWAMKHEVKAVMRPDDVLELRWVRVP
ncbi:ABC transporter substrate-binding protein [Rubrivivax gelatinosus]|uniref:Peptide/nickel transport system substrate-binding protein n=1 Tax=Rubrivivax gelatinosus TaxID=28068 RepID=A0A4R2M5A1_RUBGE|nr:ABC transporter substrate-binding protein [Rubrivivax gelatinosus]TCP01762.1 peptide/nickel transport system substrate-binding protein [Rubrivivax gelatinosus]